MKKLLVLLSAILLLTFFGCTPNMPPADENTDFNTETSTIHPCNTYAILRAEQERITEYIQNNLCGDLITGIGVDDSRGVLIVSMKEVNEENIKFFKENISDKDFIEFIEGISVVTSD